MSTSLLEIADLTVEIDGQEALTAVELDVRRGECLGLVGETGAGKTLVTRVMTGTLGRIGARIVSGTVLFDGVDLVRLSGKGWQPLRGRRVALVPQSSMSALDPLMTVGRQLVEAIRTLDREVADRMRRASDLLTMVEMERPQAVLKSYAHQLSGGMRQRVMIALALAGRPELIVADEPTTALDVTVQRGVLELLSKLRREQGMSLVLVSHDLGVVQAMAERVVIMYAGLTVEEGPTAEVLAHPLHPYTRALLAARPEMADRGARLRVARGAQPGLGERPAGCRFASRCEFAVADCRLRLPELRSAASGHHADHRAACIRFDELFDD